MAQILKSSRLRKLRGYLLAESDKSLSNELERFFGAPGDNNLMPVIRALRHSMFHGQFTPSGAGLTSKYAQEVLEQIEHKFFQVMELASAKAFMELSATATPKR